VRLRPAKDLDLNDLDPEVLTTYAGLLFRDLIDRFDGDVVKAAAAYNGGPGNPNMRYADGVGLVAGYARKMLEGVTALHDQSIANNTFVAPAPR
jgi:soluble lytic murein transglycosylase-like protein